jgi:hypothetical protein
MSENPEPQVSFPDYILAYGDKYGIGVYELEEMVKNMYLSLHAVVQMREVDSKSKNN